MKPVLPRSVRFYRIVTVRNRAFTTIILNLKRNELAAICLRQIPGSGGARRDTTWRRDFNTRRRVYISGLRFVQRGPHGDISRRFQLHTSQPLVIQCVIVGGPVCCIPIPLRPCYIFG